MKSIKADKKIGDWVVAMYCDYGIPGKKRMIRASYSKQSAQNSWLKLYKMFSKNGRRCWQEDRSGNILNDSKE